MNNNNDNNREAAAEPRRKQTRRRTSQSRKSSTATGSNYRFITMAEARREVALALQLHRASTSYSSAPPPHHPTPTSTPTPPLPTVSYCYSAVDTLPTPGPVWSTTSPSVLAQPHYYSAGDYHDDDGQPGAAAAWMGYLATTDSARQVDEDEDEDEEEASKYPGQHLFGVAAPATSSDCFPADPNMHQYYCYQSEERR